MKFCARTAGYTGFFMGDLMNQTQTDLLGDPVQPTCDFYGFLVAYATRMRGQVFGAEEVTVAAVEAGVLPQSAMRSTGTDFTRAAKEGYIRRADAWYPRQFGNGTQARAWVGV